MTRKEICETLRSTRKELGLKLKDVCREMDTTSDVICRYECGTKNFNAQKLLQYLDVLKSELYIITNSQSIALQDYEDLCNVIARIRKEAGLTQRTLAEIIGKTSISIANMETKNNAVMLDTLVAINEACGTKLMIKRKEA